MRTQPPSSGSRTSRTTAAAAATTRTKTHSITGGLRRHSGTPRSEVTIKAFCLMTMVGIPAVWEFISKGILAEVNKRRVPQEHV